MCSLRFEINLFTIEGVRFASISKKTPLSKLLFAFVSLALPLLIRGLGETDLGKKTRSKKSRDTVPLSRQFTRKGLQIANPQNRTFSEGPQIAI